MQKRVMILVFLAIVLSLNTYGAYPYGEKFDTAKVLRPFYEIHRASSFTGRDTLPEESEFINGLPDLIIEDIHVPDELPRYTLLEELSLEVKNIGSGKAEGLIQVEVYIDAQNMPNCRSRYSLGGYGFSDPKLTSHTQRWRYSVIPPGATQTLYLQLPWQIGKPLAPGCQFLPLANDFTIIATVNPAGGGFGASRTPRGRILESNHNNNLFKKEIKIVDNPAIQTVEIRLAQGTTGFTMPLEVDGLTSEEFVRRTSCDLLYLPKESIISGVGEKTLNLGFLSRPRAEEQMKPGVAYFANCAYPTRLRVTGREPEPFQLDLVSKALNILPTRMGHAGLRFIDLYNGCTKGHERQVNSVIYSYVPGIRNRAGKMIGEIVPPYTSLVPGNLYFMLCDSSYGGLWDPEGVKKKFVGESHTSRPNLKPLRVQHFQGTPATGSGFRYASRAGGGTRIAVYKFSSSSYRNDQIYN